MPSLSEILQKIWAGLPGLVGLFLFLVTLGVFIAISVWEQAGRRADARLAEEKHRAAKPSPPPAPELPGAGRECPEKETQHQ